MHPHIGTRVVHSKHEWPVSDVGGVRELALLQMEEVGIREVFLRIQLRKREGTAGWAEDAVVVGGGGGRRRVE